MSDQWFNIDSEGTLHTLRLTLPEQIDSAEFDRLNELLDKTMEGSADGRWVVDLTGVEYLGSSVLGLMVNLRHRIKTAGGKLALFGLSPRLSNIFHTCSLERLFVIVPAKPAAVKAVSSQ